MILHMLIAVLLSLTQVSQTPESDDPNVFLDLGAEYCATEIAIAAFTNVSDEGEVTGPTPPEYITYSAFEFETAAQAEAVLDDIPRLVAETYIDDVDISEDDVDQMLTEVITEDYGDRSAAYILTLPVDEGDLDTLVIEFLAIVKQNQLALILLFNDTTSVTGSPGLTLETLGPFGEDLNETWDGVGDLEDAIPDTPPAGWVGEDVSTVDLPTCDQQEQ